MSALGSKKQTSADVKAKSASPTRADIPNPTLCEFDLPVVVLGPGVLVDSPETQRRYRFGISIAFCSLVYARRLG